MARKYDTEQIVHLALIPVGAIVQRADARHSGGLIGIGLHADPAVVAHGKHVVDDLEALVFAWVVDGGDVADLGVFGGGVVFEEGEDGDDARRGDVDGEFVLPYGESGGG